MSLMRWTTRLGVLASGLGQRWLREELVAHGITVVVTEGCLRELADDADAIARRQSADDATAYLSVLRREIASRAEFVRVWTQTNDGVGTSASDDHLAQIARKHALPRGWRLTDPTPTLSSRPTPVYFRWASAG